jgi:hypothetical protein
LAGFQLTTEALMSHLQSPLLLAIRLYWGWQLSRTAGEN